MFRRFFFAIVIMWVILTLPASVLANPGNGVDDLRGRWDFTLEFDEDPGNYHQFILFINDLIQNPENPDELLASGCMRAIDGAEVLPLAMSATYSGSGVYEWDIYSTVVPEDGEPYVIKFEGQVDVHGSGVTDDVASGNLLSEVSEGIWTGVHHDRRRTQCPSITSADLFQGEIYSHQDLAYDPFRVTTIFESYTVIVSSAMEVVDPLGNVYIASFYTDIFSPDVDFIGRFRFVYDFEESPIPGQVYTFTLLDALGNPIDGATSTDVWNRCNQGAPINLGTDYLLEEHLDLFWDPVPLVPGEFDQEAYQISIAQQEEQATEYGSDGIESAYHRIPWVSIVPPSDGYPDGTDFGHSLGDLEDGLYRIDVLAWNTADETNGGWGSDCAVHDSSHALILTKTGNTIEINQLGSIRGTVSDELGNPIEGIHVDACAYDEEFEPFCRGGQTNEFGNYRVLGLTGGDYRVMAFGEGWIGELYDNTTDWELAARVAVTPPDVTPDIDFALAQGGSISGTVVDEAGNPLEEIHVNACEYDNPEPYCAGAETDANGEYTIFGLPAGDYRVMIFGAPGWAGELYDDTTDWEQAARVPVTPPGVTADIDFALVQGGSISGTVYDSNGDPLVGIAVDTEFGGYGTCTDENGNYTLQGLPLGTYRVAAGREFCGPHPYLEQVSGDVIIDAAAPDAGGVDFYLQAGGGISGVVTDGTDPLEGIHVDACEYDNPEPYCAGAETDADGVFTILGLPGGDYRVNAFGEGWTGEFYNDTTDWEQAARVTVTPLGVTPDVNFALVQGGSISGTLYDSDGITPLPGIAVFTEFGDYGTCTDENGNYTLSGLPLGTYRVVAGQQDCDPHSYFEQVSGDVIIDASAPDVGGVDFNLEMGGSISGAVTDEGGNPIQDLLVMACDYHYLLPDCFSAMTYADGSYAFLGVLPGDYRVSIWQQPGWASEFFDNVLDESSAAIVTVQPGMETGSINFVLVPGGRIAGTVYAPDGATPLADVTVITSDYRFAACTYEDGVYELFGLPYADYDVIAGREDWCGGGNPYGEASSGLITIDAANPDVIWNLTLAILPF